MLTNRNDESDRLLKFLLHVGFLVSGTITVLIGQILPMLSARLSLNDTQAGYFFIAQFAGSIAGNFTTQPLVKRFGFGAATTIGFAAMCVGVLGLNSDDWIFCLAAFVVNGFGIGITLPSINMLTVELNPLRVTPALNFLNFFWGVGAIFCKPFVDFFAAGTSLVQPTLILAALLFVTGALIFFASRRNFQREFVGQTGDENLPPIWATATAWLIALFNFIHIGFESGAGGWITTYALRLPNRDGEFIWLSPTLAYFSFFVFGRLVAPLYSRFLNENRMLLLALLTTAFGVAILVTGNSLPILIMGASIAGFGTSSIFPTNMARFTKTFGATATRRATPLFISGTLGAALTTWLIGYISTSYNNLRVGMFVLLGSCVFLICLQIFLANRKSK
ncbi:MAG: MFS transporter [Pyrinomonadaceae bacterium]